MDRCGAGIVISHVFLILENPLGYVHMAVDSELDMDYTRNPRPIPH